MPVDPTQRVGRHELLLPALEQVGEEGHLGRHEQLLEAALDDQDHERDPQADAVDRQQRKQEQGEQDVHDDHQPAPIPPIDVHPRHRAEHDAGHEQGQDHAAGRQRRAGEAVDLEREPDEEDPVSDHRDQAADPQQPEIALAEEFQHSCRIIPADNRPGGRLSAGGNLGLDHRDRLVVDPLLETDPPVPLAATSSRSRNGVAPSLVRISAALHDGLRDHRQR